MYTLWVGRSGKKISMVTLSFLGLGGWVRGKNVDFTFLLCKKKEKKYVLYLLAELLLCWRTDGCEQQQCYHWEPRVNKTSLNNIPQTKMVALLSKTERSWNGSYPTCFGLSPSPSLLSPLLLGTSWFFGLFVVGQKSCSSDLSDV